MADHEFLAKHAVSQSTRPARFAAAHALADGCPNGHALQKFYTQVFGWQMQPLPGMTDSLMVPAQKDGIAGGIRASTNHQPRVAVYVTVGDIDAVFGKIQRAGGRMAMPKTELPVGLGSVAGFTDPAGNWVGIWMAAKAAAKKRSAKKARAKKKTGAKKADPRAPTKNSGATAKRKTSSRR